MSSDNPLEGLCVEHEEFQPASEMPEEFIRIKHRVTAVEVKKAGETPIEDFMRMTHTLNQGTPYDPDLYCWFIEIERIKDGG